jgi:prepilin-type N-terminal cleavage/methylation domain-containing protein/prepilin-type processing-associated H-X9-DG protein
MRRAFTLIELLVVIAIIAVLMAILMPSLQLAKDHAVRIHCISNVKTLSMAWFMYKDDFDDKLVSAMTPMMSATGAEAQAGWVRLANNWNSGATLEEKRDAIKAGALWSYAGKNIDLYRCPADRRVKLPNLPVARSFSIPDGANGEGWPDGAAVVAKRYSELKQPASKYIFIEDFDSRGGNQNSWAMDFPNTLWDPVAIWHNNRTSFGFADGHAEMHSWRDKAFIEWCNRCLGAALFNEGGFSFDGFTPPGDQMEDYNFLARGFPCRSHR